MQSTFPALFYYHLLCIQIILFFLLFRCIFVILIEQFCQNVHLPLSHPNSGLVRCSVHEG